MSLKPSRRNLNAVSKVKLGDLCPLPEPVDEMAVEVEQQPPGPAFSERVLPQQPRDSEMYDAMNMLSSLRLGGAISGNTTPSLSRDTSFDEDFVFDSVDDSEQDRSWQLSGDTGSSDFGNSVASFMSWTDDIEIETTKKVQELVDELEKCMYGEESLDKLKKEVSTECGDWTSKFPHIRVTGAGIIPDTFQLERFYGTVSDESNMPSDEMGEREDESEEVFASHGSYQEEVLQDTDDGRGDTLASDSDSSRPNTAESAIVYYDRVHAEENLKQKVKDYVMEQLFAYVWNEVSRNMEPLVKLYSERTLQSRYGRPASTQRPASRYTTTCASPQFLPAVETARAFTPISDIPSSELSKVLQVSSKSIHHSARQRYIRPSLEPSLEMDETLEAHIGRADSMRQSSGAPLVRLPQSLSLRSANHALAPMPTTEVRGYHSAADRRTRSMLNRRFNSMSSGPERFLKPLEEKSTAISKMDSSQNATPRQVSAPTSPPSWSRHVTLPPIENLDPYLKLQSLNSSLDPRMRSIEVSPRSTTSGITKQKGLSPPSKPWMRIDEVSPRPIASAKHKILSPIQAPDTIRIEGTGLSKIELAKQLLEAEEDLLFEKSSKVIEANGLCKYSSL